MFSHYEFYHTYNYYLLTYPYTSVLYIFVVFSLLNIEFNSSSLLIFILKVSALWIFTKNGFNSPENKVLSHRLVYSDKFLPFFNTLLGF